MRLIDKEEKIDGKLKDETVKSYARSTEVSFIDQLLDKTHQAAIDLNVKQIVVGGGVSANSYLRSEIVKRFENTDIKVLIPPLWCTTDNAAMIAKCAHHLIQKGEYASLSCSSFPDLDLEN